MFKPRGWHKTGTHWFVDKTGHGLDWEPALTWQQFRRQLAGYILRHPARGFAITEEAWQRVSQSEVTCGKENPKAVRLYKSRQDTSYMPRRGKIWHIPRHA